MRFEIHKKCRFDLDCSEGEYKAALYEYLRHLSSMDFSEALPVLRYFGLSFFHDSTISSIDFDSLNSAITLYIYRDNDKEDLDVFREMNHMPHIDWAIYESNPIVYKCSFTGLSNLKLSANNVSDFQILDSEIDYVDQENEYSITFSFNENERFQIYCNAATIDIVNPETIREYTNGAMDTVPYCKLCKDSLVTPEDLIMRLRENS